MSSVINNLDSDLWVEKYRPRCVQDTILPPRIKNFLLECAETQVVKNYTAVGDAGSGKTSSIRALLDEIGADYLILNASEIGNIETIRTTVREYATKMTMNPLGYKVIVLDEADGLTATAQNALRGVIEEFQETCRFVLTANKENKITTAIKSRCPVIEFKFTSKAERNEMIKQFFTRIEEILKENKVEYDRKELLLFIDKNFPDFRQMLHLISRNIIKNCLELKNVGAANEDRIKELVSYLRGGDFGKMRKWVAEGMDTETSAIRRALYDLMGDKTSGIVQDEYIPYLVLLLNKYDYQDSFVVDKEINMVAMCTEIMKEIEFK